jgi:hypothetical protein
VARLVGPFGEIWELTPLRSRLASHTELTDDLADLERALALLTADPVNLAVLRMLALPHLRTASLAGAPSRHELKARLGAAIRSERLHLRLLRPGWAGPQLPSAGLGGVKLKDLAPAAPATPATPAPPQPPIVKVLDWKLGCQHEIDGQQRIALRGTHFAVVPDGKGGASDKKDIAELWYRNDHEPPPGSLRYAPSGGSDLSASDNGVQGGGYHHYPVPVEFLGETDHVNFLLPAYWRAFNSRTSYVVRDGPSAITIDVHYPYTWTFAVKLPPLKSYKAGAKLEANVEKNEKGKLEVVKVEAGWTRTETSWTPSTQKATFESQWGKAETDGKSAKGIDETIGVSGHKRHIDSITLTRSDGLEAKLDVAEYISQIAWLAASFNRVIDNILDVAPKVGWYIDLDLQLFQGGLLVQWGWKEHTDHRAYRWVDSCVELTIFAVKLEFGFGVAGLSFAAQVYAAVAGDVKVSADAQRPSPEVEATVKIPLQGSIKGMLGVRFQAGYVFRINAHGETGLEVGVDMRFNDGNRPVSLNGETKWTGIFVQATVSAGLFGIGGQKTWSRQLVNPCTLDSFAWPRAEPYNPPWMSRERMAAVLQRVLTAGLDVRVFKPSGSFFSGDEKWPMERIVDTLAAKLDGNQTMRRDPKTIEGMAHGIREDLDAIGRRFGRDWITEEKFLEYVNGPKLAARMEQARDLGRDLLQQCGA